MKKKSIKKLLLGLSVSAMLLLGMSTIASAASSDIEAQLLNGLNTKSNQEMGNTSKGSAVITNDLKAANMTNFIQTNSTQNSITMSWNAIPGASSYIYAYAEYGATTGSNTFRGSGNSLTIKGLAPNKYYVVRVQVLDSYNRPLTSTYQIVCATTPSNIAVSKTDSNPRNKNYTFYLSAPSHANYSTAGIRIKYYNYKTKKSTTKYFATFTPTIKLNRNAAYKVTITPYAEILGKKYYGSNTVRYAMKHPTIKKAGHTSSSMTVKWTKMKGVTNYTVYVKKPGGKFKKMTTTKGSSYTVKNMKANKKYYIKIVANKKVGKKVWKSNIKDEYYYLMLQR